MLVGELEQPANQGVVGLVAGAMSDDEPLQVEAQQSQVADHVEILCARIRRESAGSCR